jgi:hypothetical protein
MSSKIIPKEGMLQVEDRHVRCLEAGSGERVLVFPDAGGEPFDALAAGLAERRCVIVIPPDAAGSEDTGLGLSLSHALIPVGPNSYSLIGIGRGVIPAITLATAASDQVNRLVLLSPPHSLEATPQAADLAQIKAPALVVVGTRENSGTVKAARLCRERIPSCHLMFLYGAGPVNGTDRAPAYVELVTDFLDKGEQFVIVRDSQLISQ